MNRWTRFLALSTFALGTIGQGAAIAALAPQSSSLEGRDRDNLELTRLFKDECAAVVDRRARLYDDPAGSKRKSDVLREGDVVVIRNLEAADFVYVEQLRNDDVYGFVRADALEADSVNCREFDRSGAQDAGKCATVEDNTRVYGRPDRREYKGFQLLDGMSVRIINGNNSRWPYVEDTENPRNFGYVSRADLGEFVTCRD